MPSRWWCCHTYNQLWEECGQAGVKSNGMEEMYLWCSGIENTDGLSKWWQV